MGEKGPPLDTSVQNALGISAEIIPLDDTGFYYVGIMFNPQGLYLETAPNTFEEARRFRQKIMMLSLDLAS